MRCFTFNFSCLRCIRTSFPNACTAHCRVCLCVCVMPTTIEVNDKKKVNSKISKPFCILFIKLTMSTGCARRLCSVYESVRAHFGYFYAVENYSISKLTSSHLWMRCWFECVIKCRCAVGKFIFIRNLQAKINKKKKKTRKSCDNLDDDDSERARGGNLLLSVYSGCAMWELDLHLVVWSLLK